MLFLKIPSIYCNLWEYFIGFNWKWPKCTQNVLDMAVLTLGRLRRESQEFKASLPHRGRTYIKKDKLKMPKMSPKISTLGRWRQGIESSRSVFSHVQGHEGAQNWKNRRRVAQLAKCWVCKHQDLSSDLQRLSQNPVCGHVAPLLGRQTQAIPGLLASRSNRNMDLQVQ